MDVLRRCQEEASKDDAFTSYTVGVEGVSTFETLTGDEIFPPCALWESVSKALSDDVCNWFVYAGNRVLTAVAPTTSPGTSVTFEQTRGRDMEMLQRWVLDSVRAGDFESFVENLHWKPKHIRFPSDPRISSVHSVVWKAMGSLFQVPADAFVLALSLEGELRVKTCSELNQGAELPLFRQENERPSGEGISVSMKVWVEKIFARIPDGEGHPPRSLVDLAAHKKTVSWLLKVCLSSSNALEPKVVRVKVPVRLGGLARFSSVMSAINNESGFMKDGVLYSFTPRFSPTPPRGWWFKDNHRKKPQVNVDRSVPQHVYVSESGFTLNVVKDIEGRSLVRLQSGPYTTHGVGFQDEFQPLETMLQWLSTDKPLLRGHPLCESVSKGLHAALLCHEHSAPILGRYDVEHGVRTCELIVADAVKTAVARSLRASEDVGTLDFWGSKLVRKEDYDQWKIASSEVGMDTGCLEVTFARGDRPESRLMPWLLAPIPSLVDNDDETIGVAQAKWTGTKLVTGIESDARVTAAAAIMILSDEQISTRPVAKAFYNYTRSETEIVLPYICGVQYGEDSFTFPPDLEINPSRDNHSDGHVKLCVNGLPFAAVRNDLYAVASQKLLDKGVLLTRMEDGIVRATCDPRVYLQELLKRVGGSRDSECTVLFNGAFLSRARGPADFLAETLRNARKDPNGELYVPLGLCVLHYGGVLLLDSQPAAYAAAVAQHGKLMRPAEAAQCEAEPVDACLPFGPNLERLLKVAIGRRMLMYKFSVKGEHFLNRSPVPDLFASGLTHLSVRNEAAVICCKEVHGEDAILVSRSFLARKWSLYIYQARIQSPDELKRVVRQGEVIGRDADGQPVTAELEMALLDYCKGRDNSTFVQYGGLRSLDTGDKLTVEAQKFVATAAGPESIGAAAIHSNKRRCGLMRMADVVVDLSSIVNRQSKDFVDQLDCGTFFLHDPLLPSEARPVLAHMEYTGIQANKPASSKGTKTADESCRGDVYWTPIALQTARTIPKNPRSGYACGKCNAVYGKRVQRTMECTCGGSIHSLMLDEHFVLGALEPYASANGVTACLPKLGPSMESPFGDACRAQPPAPRETRTLNRATYMLERTATGHRVLWLKVQCGLLRDLLHAISRNRVCVCLAEILHLPRSDPEEARDAFRKHGRVAHSDDFIAAKAIQLAAPILPGDTAGGVLEVPVGESFPFEESQLRYADADLVRWIKSCLPGNVVFRLGSLPQNVPDVFDERYIAHDEMNTWDIGLRPFRGVPDDTVIRTVTTCDGWALSCSG